MNARTIYSVWGRAFVSSAILAACFFPGNVLPQALDNSGSSSAGSSASTVAPSDPAESSVVKVFSTVRHPDPYKPWAKMTPSEISGSGVVIKGHRILTNSHVVLYASQVQVQASDSGNLVSATVEAIAPSIDLAVLKLDDDSFFNTHPPLEWATGVPQVMDPVTIYGYPLGGDNLSITRGIISRVEFAGYNYPVGGLRVQIDAAVNPGNSGGPALVNGRMIGIAFSRLGGTAENIGYIIPCEEIRLFLEKTAGGHEYSKPMMFDECETLSSAALRGYLNLDSSVQGVVVIKPAETNADYPLKKWDLITHMGDTPVDDEGMVHLSDDLRVYFKYMVQKDGANGTVPVTILRGGKEMKVSVPLTSNRPMLMPFINGGYPSYFVYGPIVFSQATDEFVSGFSTTRVGIAMITLSALAGNPLITRMGDEPAFDGEELVVVASPLFPDRLSRGYANPFGEVVESVNGIHIKNLKHLVQVLRDSKDKYVSFEFYGRNTQIMVFPREEMMADTDSILMDNDIRSQGTPDVMAVWNAGTAK
ncbi:MAG TPA: trypsin-like peptidase domain-containing protein [Pseudomonadales bacterium]|nr:trypsin-like peptidase domain-containing protein [Pseudomonadales bacterium]